MCAHNWVSMVVIETQKTQINSIYLTHTLLKGMQGLKEAQEGSGPKSWPTTSWVLSKFPIKAIIKMFHSQDDYSILNKAYVKICELSEPHSYQHIVRSHSECVWGIAGCKGHATNTVCWNMFWHFGGSITMDCTQSPIGLQPPPKNIWSQCKNLIGKNGDCTNSIQNTQSQLTRHMCTTSQVVQWLRSQGASNWQCGFRLDNPQQLVR